MDKINTVIIGMGRMGKTRYDAMVRHGGYNILAVCDEREKILGDYQETHYTDWKQCIDETHPQAVVVCTVNYAIPDIVCYALEQDMYVFSEKPPGRTLDDAIRMSEYAKRSDGLLKFGFNHRVHNSVIEAKALVDSGILGDIVCIRGVYGKAGNVNFPNEWRNDPKLSGGGILLDQGIHMIDLMCYLLESELKVVHGEVDNLVWHDIKTEDSAIAILKTSKGQVITLHSNAIQWRHKFDMDILCSNGYIALNGLLTSSRSYGEERITYYKKDLETKTGRLGKPKEYNMCFDADESWDIEMAEFYDAVTSGQAIKNGTPDDAIRVMRIVEEIYSLNNS